MAKSCGLRKVFVHAILDGRDTPRPAQPSIFANWSKDLTIGNRKGSKRSGRTGRWIVIAAGIGRKAYYSYIQGRGRRASGSLDALEKAYREGETDEFVLPTVITDQSGNPTVTVQTEDALIFFNFRADRARQISRAFVERQFKEFDRGKQPPYPFFVSMTEYDPHLKVPVVFPPEYLTDTLGETVAAAGLRQLRIAETEKYAHVTYFFNGGVEKIFSGEQRILVPSPDVATYDLKPEMSAPEVTRETLKVLDAGQANFIVLNYANADMVGHTGKLKETIQAVETVDFGVGVVVEEVCKRKGTVMITSDHGNAEKMVAEGGSPHTAHTSNDTPFILIAPDGEYSCQPEENSVMLHQPY